MKGRRAPRLSTTPKFFGNADGCILLRLLLAATTVLKLLFAVLFLLRVTPLPPICGGSRFLEDESQIPDAYARYIRLDKSTKDM